MICVFWHENKQSWKVSSKSVTMREQLGSMATENWCYNTCKRMRRGLSIGGSSSVQRRKFGRS